MMLKIRGVLVASLVALTLPVAAGGQSSAQAIFQEGLMMERAEGKLRAAIFRYERVVAEFPSDRLVLAQALHRLALAYEKLGDPRAALMWSRLAAGAPNPYTAEANKKIKAAQSADASGPFVSRALGPPYLVSGSPDGRWAAYYKGEQQNVDIGKLYVRDLVTDSERVLLDVDGLIANPTWSPDSRQLAFYFRNTVQRVRDIRIVPVDGGAIRSLGVAGFPVAWTTRGELLFYPGSSTAAVDMFLVPVAGGQPRKVYSEDVNETCGWAVTPDGGSLAACRAKRLVMHDLASGAERALTTGSGDESTPSFSRDGRLVAFKSNEDGKWGLYVAPVDRLPVSRPLRIAAFDGAGAPSAGPAPAPWWTADGLLALRLTFEERNVYRVDVDPRTGRATDSPRRLTQDAPQNFSPSISSDGARIAYLYRNGAKRGIAVMDASGQNERPLMDYVYRLPLYWQSPDEILLHDVAGTAAAAGNIVALDIRTGATEPIGRIAGAYWWTVPARREILHVYPSGAGYLPGAELKAFSLPDAKDRVVAKIDFLAPRLAVSPDGKRIAYTVAPSRAGGPPATGCELALMTPDGVREKVLIPSSQPCHTAAAWSPDGRFLLLDTPQGPTVMNVETRDSWPLHADAAGPSWEGGTWAPDGSFVTLTRSVQRTEHLAWEHVTYDAVVRLMNAKP